MLLRILRDPIWQMVGVVVAVVTFMWSVSQTSIGPRHLSAVHTRQAKAIDTWLPGERVRLLVEGTIVDPETTVVDYFLLINDAARPILSGDYVSEITVEALASSTRIVRVESCDRSYAQACSVDGSSTPQGGAYSAMSWRVEQGAWSARGPLLNESDRACVAVITNPEHIKDRSTQAFVKLSARVAGVDFKSYDTWKAYEDSARRWYDSLRSSIRLVGASLYAFFVIAALLMFATLKLAALGNGSPGQIVGSRGLAAASALCLLSASTSAILSDLLFNRRGNLLDPKIHFITWPMLFGFLALLIFLVVRARRAQSLTLRQIPYLVPHVARSAA